MTESRWVHALTFGGETTAPQRQRNCAVYQRLKDGDGTGDHRTSGLAGFVYEVPVDTVSYDGGEPPCLRFRLDKDSDCFYRLLHVITDHFDATCDADDEVVRLRARVAELEAEAAQFEAHNQRLLAAAARAWTEQSGKMVAEAGTLRTRITEMEDKVQQLDRTYVKRIAALEAGIREARRVIAVEDPVEASHLLDERLRALVGDA